MITTGILTAILVLINIYFYKTNDIKRNSNLELLRIFSMFLIVAHHFALHGYDLNEIYFSNKKIILDFLVLGGKIGVNIFILISSYYLVDREIKYKGLLKLVFRVKLYAIFFLGMTLIFNRELIGLKSLIKSIFPISYQLYWFITGYILLYLFGPYINILLKNISKNKLKKLLFLSLILYIGINVFMGAKLFFSSIIWFILLYIMTYYIKYYFDFSNLKKIYLTTISIIMYFSLYLSVLVFDYLGERIHIFRTHSLYFIRENSIFSLGFSVAVFLLFLKLNFKRNKLINYIASGTLGIYLVHENIFVREFLYQSILKNNESLSFNFSSFILHCVFGLFFVFFGSFMLSKVLDFFFDIILLNYVNFEKLESYIERKIDIVLNYSKN